MAFPRNSLRAFLAHAKSSLAAAIKQKQRVTIVTGNESADLDSLTSAILYAYFRSIIPPQSAFTPLYVPLLNIPASDINLRPEFSALFRHANISASHLVTRDDLPPSSQLVERLSVEHTRWVLVDHNKLSGDLGDIYGARVHGVIDHHAEEEAVTRDTNPEPRIIEKSGSCTSLVVHYFRSTWDAISDSSLSSGAGHAQSSDSTVNDSAVTRGWDAQIAQLALGSILEDTANLTSSSKTEAVDTDIVAYLEAMIQLSPKDARTWNRDQFYNEITAAKRNIDGLSADNVLRKDYKEWTENGMKLGMSSIVKPLSFFIAKVAEEQGKGISPDVDNALATFMGDRKLSIFAVMTASTSENGKFQRELLMQATGLAENAANRFVALATGELGLQDIGQDEKGNGSPWRATWLQKETDKSRKQVAPLIRRAMS